MIAACLRSPGARIVDHVIVAGLGNVGTAMIGQLHDRPLRALSLRGGPVRP
jgi:hypothetical protein